MDKPGLEGRCGTCVRFVSVREVRDAQGVVRRAGTCLLGVWPSPLFETNTCAEHLARGTVAQTLAARSRPAGRGSAPRGAGARERSTAPSPRRPLELPEDLLAMDASEFRAVLREVLREELGVGATPLAGRWEGGEVILKPGKEGTAEKRLPIEALFHKVVMVRDKLRVLEQRINSHGKLTGEEKVQLQSYITGCYGSLTTFNLLFADKADAFTGQKGDREE